MWNEDWGRDLSNCEYKVISFSDYADQQKVTYIEQQQATPLYFSKLDCTHAIFNKQFATMYCDDISNRESSLMRYFNNCKLTSTMSRIRRYITNAKENPFEED